MKMRREQRAKIRRLSVWFLINLSIFVACYLNYRFQLKHRYLYKTLNIGLCLSRAAAMVINFNLLLVWLPMCKYSLTRLACLAINSIRRQREQDMNDRRETILNQIISSTLPQPPSSFETLKHGVKLSNEQQQQQYPLKFSTNNKLFKKFKTSVEAAFKQLDKWFRISKLNFINSFLIAVDHCKSLHTISATTITIASVIHTVAHLMNVINFSRNYDAFLSNLNMAEFKGQNPMQLLVSVPGITGSLMIIILILMSLSSVDVIRNSSYDLFQIFHRLSVIFVLLLFLHPSSHVLKEQSNVDRHHPDFCHTSAPSNTVLNHNSSLPISATQVFETQTANSLIALEVPADAEIALPASAGGHQEGGEKSASIHQGQAGSSSSNKFVIAAVASRVKNSTTDLKIMEAAIRNNDNSSAITREDSMKIHSRNKRNLLNNSSSGIDSSNSELNSKSVLATTETETKTERKRKRKTTTKGNRKERGTNVRKIMCLDEKPLFVAQSSICWYVLSIGLSCYLLDLILRKKRRSKSTIQLLEVHLDCEGNLIELVLSSNHKRFSYWLPGQFIYLNCPQIASYEWHPFTISSMDNKSRRFTLHIKTGGDWTRKLRQKLEFCAQCDMRKQATQQQQRQRQRQRQQYSMSLCKTNLFDSKLEFNGGSNLNSGNIISKSSSICLDLDNPILPNFNCYDGKTGEPQIECTKVTRIIHNDTSEEDGISGGCLQVNIVGNGNGNNYSNQMLSQDQNQHQEQQQKLYSICHKLDIEERSSLKAAYENLELFIDGPFHSPFERLLEQQVSVCIASGVGWTAFSSVFQCITNNFNSPSIVENKRDWWSKWHNFATNNIRSSLQQNNDNSSIVQASKISKLPKTKLHLMVIVTSIEQLKPFYYLALNYFQQIHQECQIEVDDRANPVKEITAFITRSSKDDESAKEFYRQENIHYLNDNQDQIVQVNDIFSIKFGKPCFESYLAQFNSIYRQKISIYCCGSYQVKKTVQEICGGLNKSIRNSGEQWPFYAYHEENF